MKYNWFDVTNENLEKWSKFCPPDEYRIYSGSEINTVFSGLLPDGLTNKYDSVVVAGSSTIYGTTYYMANGNRIDPSASAIDQMPFGLAFIGENAAGSACLIQHGDWINRTIHPPQDFWVHASASSIDSYYPLSELPSCPQGKFSELKIDSQNEAFGKLVNRINKQLEE